MISEVVF